MKNRKIVMMIFCSILLSSCGLIEKFKTPEQSTASNENTSTTALTADSLPSDDLFNTNSTDTKKDVANNIGTDAPSNINTTTPAADNNTDELSALKDEFTGNGPQESQVSEVAPQPQEENKNVVSNEAPILPDIAQKEPEAKPLKVEESMPEVNKEDQDAKVTSTGEIKNYKVQKGETLMQIAFKLYGDVSRWKDIKKLNGDKLSSNTALRSNLKLKYMEPETPFVWNPEGKPYMIKTGETLGIISNNVYHTPKKWKSIWENNKPLIKNPNVIYAGFTLYYKDGDMANYVQPKSVQPKIVKTKTVKPKVDEEIKVENALTAIERLDSAQEINDIQSSTVRTPRVQQEDDQSAIPDTTPTPQPDEQPMTDEPTQE